MTDTRPAAPKKGMRYAINEKCKDCIYDPLSKAGNWRQQVGACTDVACHLWPYRPKSTGRSETAPNSAISGENAA